MPSSAANVHVVTLISLMNALKQVMSKAYRRKETFIRETVTLYASTALLNALIKANHASLTNKQTKKSLQFYSKFQPCAFLMADTFLSYGFPF